MKTSSHAQATLDNIAGDIRRATTPSLPSWEQPIDDQLRLIYASACACRILADDYAAAGEMAMAAAMVAQGRALKAEYRRLAAEHEVMI